MTLDRGLRGSAAVATWLVAFGPSALAAPAAPRGFIGDSGSGWDTRAGVSVRVSSQADSSTGLRAAVHAIDGTGLDPGGLYHTHYLHPSKPIDTAPPYPYDPAPDCSMWLSDPEPAGDSGQRGGTVRGSQWIEFSFDRAVPLGEMWVWNYNENNHIGRPDGEPPGLYWSAMGMRQVTVQYSVFGGEDPSRWTTIYEGPMPRAQGHPRQEVNLVVDFRGAEARYVVITAADGLTATWAPELTSLRDSTQAGLSEVRFYPAAAAGAAGGTSRTTQVILVLAICLIALIYAWRRRRITV